MVTFIYQNRTHDFYHPVANNNDIQDGLPERLSVPKMFFKIIGTGSSALN